MGLFVANNNTKNNAAHGTNARKLKTVDIVPGAMAKPMIEPDHASGNDVHSMAGSTVPATVLGEEEDMTSHAFDETHSKEGLNLSEHEDDDDDDDLDNTMDESLRDQEFFKSIKPLNRTPSGRLPRARSGSILKSSSEDLHVSDKRNKWKSLPKPDMVKIRSQSVPVTEAERTEATEKKSVRFDAIDVRNYSQTLGDNPSCSYGPPVQLDWDFEEGGSVKLEDYEANRGPRRKLRHMMMNYYMRKNLLQWKVGCSEEELKEAQRNAERVKSQRAMTRAMLPACKIEDAFQSACRKARRAFKSKA
mmetsp:Transcript_16959/g.37034  ORF Transcript_16959/g.37034 Transcript_16959/m.37034 type:complete len:304 (+) Transcript_16959:84-995(+)|eukprot:CAMPEP_0168735174 /NCGR_PEP_ID=MMETSP0724-20121128/9194_1 /TAXON_ID=265536 /ORGANISM="Amphiprora sp., Strain CCMP467" /LENGTH=303 /DNA_ID=CAMNT_0008782303 /DNA_START=41 /DNA_END=952 /DNA_ORIENTATION=-